MQHHACQKEKAPFSSALYFLDYDRRLVEDFLCAAHNFSTTFPSFLACPLRADPNFPGNPFRSVPRSAYYVPAASVGSTGNAAPPITSHRDRLSAHRRGVG